MKKTFILNESQTSSFEEYSDISQKIWYHGRSIKSEEFSLDYIDPPTANKQPGGGFYFTNSLSGARGYAFPDGVVLKCEINYDPSRFLNTKKKPSLNLVKNLINNSPDKEDVLSNFDENLTRAFYEAVSIFMDIGDAFHCYTTIENDLYRDNSKDFLKTFGKFFDGYMIPPPPNGEYQNFVCYRPEIIKVIDKIDYKPLWED